MWHSFDYYLEEFYKNFFPNINLEKLKLKYKKELKKINKELYKKNFEHHPIKSIVPWNKESWEVLKDWKTFSWEALEDLEEFEDSDR